jgi:hypothetical protein
MIVVPDTIVNVALIAVGVPAFGFWGPKVTDPLSVKVPG